MKIKKYGINKVTDRKNISLIMELDMWIDLDELCHHRNMANIPNPDIAGIIRKVCVSFLETRQLIGPTGNLDVRSFIEAATGSFMQLDTLYAKEKGIEELPSLKLADISKWAIKTVKSVEMSD